MLNFCVLLNIVFPTLNSCKTNRFINILYLIYSMVILLNFEQFYVKVIQNKNEFVLAYVFYIEFMKLGP